MHNNLREIIRLEVFKTFFLNENELYIDLTDIPEDELYPEEKLRLNMGLGKSGQYINGEFVEVNL